MCSLQVEDLSLAAMYSHVRWRDQESRGPLHGHVDGRSPAVAARQLLSVAAAQRGADVQQADLSHVVCRPVVAGKWSPALVKVCGTSRWKEKLIDTEGAGRMNAKRKSKKMKRKEKIENNGVRRENVGRMAYDRLCSIVHNADVVCSSAVSRAAGEFRFVRSCVVTRVTRSVRMTASPSHDGTALPPLPAMTPMVSMLEPFV